MKSTQLAVFAATILFNSAALYAGHGYFTELGRNIGYGISDGYHAQRYCLNAGTACSNCSPVQASAIQQPLVPQPMMMQQQPMMVPAYTERSPQQFFQPIQPTGYPYGYPAAQVYPPSYQPIAPDYRQPMMPSVATPHRMPSARW